MITGCPNSTFFAAGLRICAEKPVASEEIEILVNIVEDKTNDIYPEVIDSTIRYKEEGVEVWFIDGYMAEKCITISNEVVRCRNYLGGYTTNNGHNIYVSWRKCLAVTSLAHELLHTIQYFYLDGPEGEGYERVTPGHETPKMFIIDANRQNIPYSSTIEYQIFDIAVKLLPSCQ